MSEMTIDLNLLREKTKLFVSVPMYGGMCHGIFTKSTNQLATMAGAYGLDIRFHYLFNESLIQRARNYCADEFLRSDCTHLMFIDSDIGFNAQDVITMLWLSVNNEKYDILTAPYQKKMIAWEKVKQAVDKGFADKDPTVLENFVGDFVFNPIHNKNEIPLNEPAEVMEAGTGFMLIKREVFEKYKEAYPQYSYKPDHVRSANFDGSREIHAYFDCSIDPNSKRYLSEDYHFVTHARKAGMNLWMCPWIHLQHAGSYIFSGSLSALAMVGAPATVDMSKINKK